MDNDLVEALTDAQLKLLSKTLQISEQKSNGRDEVGGVIKMRGLCPELKVRNSFAASFTGVEKNQRLLNQIFQQHEVFNGTGSTDNIIYEPGVVNLRGREFRKKVWDKNAIIIQSAWRGTSCRLKLLKQFSAGY